MCLIGQRFLEVLLPTAFLLLFYFSSQQVHAANKRFNHTQDFYLTAEEQGWLAQNHKIRVRVGKLPTKLLC